MDRNDDWGLFVACDGTAFHASALPSDLMDTLDLCSADLLDLTFSDLVERMDLDSTEYLPDLDLTIRSRFREKK